jgi:hypothetical protein
VQVKNIENLIYQSIKAYRNAEGEDGPFVHQYFVVGEAQIYSYKMANGVVEVNTDGLDVHWDALNEKYAFYNHHALVLKTTSTTRRKSWTNCCCSPMAKTRCWRMSPSAAWEWNLTPKGNNYITVLLMKADS